MNKITLKDFMECIGYKITEGSDYQWQCYGPYVYQLDSWNGKFAGDGGHTINVVFDTVTQIVYQMEAWDDDNDRAYRWVNPLYIDKLKAEYAEHGLVFNHIIDHTNYIDVEVAEDMLEKSKAIANGEPYDTRLQVELNLSDEDMLMLMKLAHEKDMSLNKYVEHVLENAISKLENKNE